MPASVTVQTLRGNSRQLSYGMTMPQLWQVMRDEWQRLQERAVARAVRNLDHAGVSEDYRMARRGNHR